MEKEEKEENFRRVERQYGSFTRSFTLPSSVDPGQVSADYYQGVLKIRLAKKADAKPKQIKVNVGGEKERPEPRLSARPRNAVERNGGWQFIAAPRFEKEHLDERN